MTWVIGISIGLPLSVWFLATLFELIDEPSFVPALVRLALMTSGVLVLLIWIGPTLLLPFATAMIIVGTAHLASFVFIRQFGTGVTIHQNSPATPPLLVDAVSAHERLATSAEAPERH